MYVTAYSQHKGGSTRAIVFNNFYAFDG